MATYQEVTGKLGREMAAVKREAQIERDGLIEVLKRERAEAKRAHETAKADLREAVRVLAKARHRQRETNIALVRAVTALREAESDGASR